MSEWISINDRLPEEGQAVMVYMTIPPNTPLKTDARPLNRCWFMILEFHADMGIPQFIDYFSNPHAYITHWMPLPEPPT